MILTEYDEEKVKEMFKKEYWKDGYNDGYSIGKQESEMAHNHEKYMIASRMIAKGMSYNEVAEFFDVAPEKLKEMLSVDKVHEDIADLKQKYE